ncbi:MAG TPA: hypothetical protein VJ246_00290 [Patescibacteria group bacterium]|nr:hypothetical protein [Patescibacteria group bacterium]
MVRVETAGGEDVKDINRFAVSSAWRSLESKIRNEGSHKVKLKLTLQGQEKPCLLQFETSRTKIGLVTIVLSIHEKGFQGHGLVAKRVFEFYAGKNFYINIHSYSITESGYEGHGLGSGLFLLSDLVIYKIMTIFSSELSGKSITAHIADSAHTQDDPTSRTRWTSAMAAELGYEPVGSGSMNQFEKVYQ